MANEMKQTKPSVSRTEWTLYMLAVTAGIVVTLTAIAVHIF